MKKSLKLLFALLAVSLCFCFASCEKEAELFTPSTVPEVSSEGEGFRFGGEATIDDLPVVDIGSLS